MDLKVKPISDRIWIKPIATDTEIGGFDLAQEAYQKQPRGVIVSAGDGKYAPHTGVLIPMQVRIGDEVIFSPHAGSEIEYEGEVYIVMQQEDLIAVI